MISMDPSLLHAGGVHEGCGDKQGHGVTGGGAVQGFTWAWRRVGAARDRTGEFWTCLIHRSRRTHESRRLVTVNESSLAGVTAGRFVTARAFITHGVSCLRTISRELLTGLGPRWVWLTSTVLCVRSGPSGAVIRVDLRTNH
jgi:hypothetical protein